MSLGFAVRSATPGQVIAMNWERESFDNVAGGVLGQ